MFDMMRTIQITGHSMELAGLYDGMWVRVRPTARAEHGDVVVVRNADDELTVKRLVRPRRRQEAWLAPESSDPAYRARRLQPDEVVVGVLVDVPRRNPACLQHARFPRPTDACTVLDFLHPIVVEQDDMAGRGILRGDEAGIWHLAGRLPDGLVVYVDLTRYGLGRRLMQLVVAGEHRWAMACPAAPREREPAYMLAPGEVLGFVRNTRRALML
jgi:hypothetical protein